MMLSSERLVFFDVETGGLDPARHPLIQFAAVVVDGDWNEVEALEAKIHFDPATADPSALAVNSYDPDIWASQALAPTIASRLLGDLFRRHATMHKVSRAGKPYTVARLAAHNAPFDTGFLGAFFKDLDEFCPAALYESLDTCALARWASLLFPPGARDHKLGTLCEWLGVQHDNAHDALTDVRATVQVARALVSKLGGASGGPRLYQDESDAAPDLLAEVERLRIALHDTEHSLRQEEHLHRETAAEVERLREQNTRLNVEVVEMTSRVGEWEDLEEQRDALAGALQRYLLGDDCGCCDGSPDQPASGSCGYCAGMAALQKAGRL